MSIAQSAFLQQRNRQFTIVTDGPKRNYEDSPRLESKVDLES